MGVEERSRALGKATCHDLTKMSDAGCEVQRIARSTAHFIIFYLIIDKDSVYKRKSHPMIGWLSIYIAVNAYSSIRIFMISQAAVATGEPGPKMAATPASNR